MRIALDAQDKAEIESLLTGMKKDAPKILSRAINRTVTQSKKRASQEIRKDLNLSASYVNGSKSRGLPGKLFTRPATRQKLSGRLFAHERGVLMTRYPHSVLKRGGVSVKIKRGGARVRIPGAFITKVDAGGRRVDVVAIPKPDLGKYTTGNNKIKVLYSPSVSQALNLILKDEGLSGLSRELLEFLFTEIHTQTATALRGY